MPCKLWTKVRQGVECVDLSKIDCILRRLRHLADKKQEAPRKGGRDRHCDGVSVAAASAAVADCSLKAIDPVSFL